MIIQSRLLLLLLGIVIASQAAELYASCRDGAEAQGICDTLMNCHPIRTLLFRGSFTDDERNYLKNSNCGTLPSSGTRMVCCPLPVDRSVEVRFSNPASLPSIGNCGDYSTHQIVEGKVVERGAYPWLARIQYYKSNKRFGYNCGGVLINERYVLTSANCIRSVPSSWTVYMVRFGEHDIMEDHDCDYHYGDKDCSNEVKDVLVSSYYVHEDYFEENGASYNNIALIRLVESVQYTSYIKPICLPISEELQKLDTSERPMTVAGWGQSENSTASRYMMHVHVPHWSNDQCREAFSPVNIDIIDTQLCAGGQKGKDSCRGDSGGPLMRVERVDRRPAWFLKGIASFGMENCGAENVPVVYTRISKYIDWIQDNIEG